MARGDGAAKVRVSATGETTPARERLLQAATEAFVRSGFQGARVNDIAKRAGANKQLVYHYFGSKDALYVAVLEQAYLTFRGDEKIIQAALEEADPELALRTLATALFSRTPSSDRFQRLIQDLNVQSNRRHLKSLSGVQEAYAKLIDAVTTILNRGVEMGKFRSGIDPKEFYISLAGTFSVRISNASTLSFVLGTDLNSKGGFMKSQQVAFDILLRGIIEDTKTSNT